MNRKLTALKRSNLWKRYIAERKPREGCAWGIPSPRSAVHAARSDYDAKESRSTPLPRFTPTGDRSFTGRIDGFDVTLSLEDNYEHNSQLCSQSKNRDTIEVDGYGTFRGVKAGRLERGEVSLGKEYDRDSMFNGENIVFLGGKDFGNDWDALYGYARDFGLAKGPAWEAAYEETKRVAKIAWQIVKGEYSFAGVKAVVSRNGTELDRDSRWGIDANSWGSRRSQP